MAEKIKIEKEDTSEIKVENPSTVSLKLESKNEPKEEVRISEVVEEDRKEENPVAVVSSTTGAQSKFQSGIDSEEERKEGEHVYVLPSRVARCTF